ncbi:MAG: hypothetical protein GX892_14505 [Thermoanaerobacteraceae bacterium]|nr:hypothetical protein [Thermoanaerobacteraceae bacterium]
MAQLPIERYEEINSMSHDEWSKECRKYNDCSSCPMALYKDLYSTTKSKCIRGMSKKEFRIEVELCDAYLL